MTAATRSPISTRTAVRSLSALENPRRRREENNNPTRYTVRAQSWGRSENRRPPQNAPRTTAERTADHHRTAQDTPQNTAGRGKQFYFISDVVPC